MGEVSLGMSNDNLLKSYLSNVIHPTAVIDDDVELGEDNYIGPYCYFTGELEIASYKMHIQTKFVSLRESSIVYFHGKPKPHELPGEPWVGVHWV